MIVTLYDLILFVSVSESYFLQLLITVATEKQPQKQNSEFKTSSNILGAILQVYN